mmetsp:Transcript_56795/g.68025  ORF Transcript_56795/g.68025 Transcript_56795/m.68025 type:complete len:134 (+) Transcript_56795:239-640(+)
MKFCRAITTALITSSSIGVTDGAFSFFSKNYANSGDTFVPFRVAPARTPRTPLSTRHKTSRLSPLHMDTLDVGNSDLETLVEGKPSGGALDIDARKVVSQSKVLTVNGEEVVIGDLIRGDKDVSIVVFLRSFG